MPRIATPRAPCRKPQPGSMGEAVSMCHYRRSLISEQDRPRRPDLWMAPMGKERLSSSRCCGSSRPSLQYVDPGCWACNKIWLSDCGPCERPLAFQRPWLVGKDVQMLRLPLPAESGLPSSSLASNRTVSGILTCSLSDPLPSWRPNRGKGRCGRRLSRPRWRSSHERGRLF